MINLKKISLLLCLVITMASCSSPPKALHPEDFHSDISTVNQNIEAANETIPNDSQHMKLQSLKKNEDDSYVMTYTMNDKLVSIFCFRTDQSLYKVILGNSKQDPYKYSKVGVPLSIIMTYFVLGDTIPEDQDSKNISIFLTSCVKDGQLEIKTNAYMYQFKKSLKQQTITIQIKKVDS